MATIDRTASAVGNFSEVVTVAGTDGTWIHVSGQVALDGTGARAVTGGVGEQTEIIFDQIERYLAACSASLSDVIKLTSYLVDLSEYAEFSAVRGRRFADFPPASAAVGVASLLLGARIEIEAVAFRGISGE
jgi:2-iminobutanoate/2-iminopropanoate deaminase